MASRSVNQESDPPPDYVSRVETKYEDGLGHTELHPPDYLPPVPPLPHVLAHDGVRPYILRSNTIRRAVDAGIAVAQDNAPVPSTQAPSLCTSTLPPSYRDVFSE